VWGDADEAQAASLDVIMVRIRKKLGGALVRTVRGGGYVIE
jgi:DNA-binding response OmpR family regulator